MKNNEQRLNLINLMFLLWQMLWWNLIQEQWPPEWAFVMSRMTSGRGF